MQSTGPSPVSRLAWSIVVLALTTVSCISESGESTTTTAATVTSSSADTTTRDPLLGLALPQDPQMRVGRLDNGMTYYVRPNDSPGGRAELRLLVDAGSVQETEEQSGVAHFLEHMMFNGTERFPRNDLISALEAFGPRFGPDINAHTSFDETVYELSVATDEDLVSLAFQVLRDWADRATITEEDVKAEQGIVLDEWRVRAQGFGGRIADAYADLILPGSPYEGRIPIGTPEQIATTTPEELRDFYQDWYRPELMAVIAVGDFDPDEIEGRIVATFSDLEMGSGPVREVLQYRPPASPRAQRLLDEEASAASFSVLWPLEARTMVTVGDFQEMVSLGLALDILATRLDDDALQGEAPLLGASPIEAGYTRTIELVGTEVDARPGDAVQALRSALVEAERIRRHGITPAEFDRALRRFEAGSRQAHQRQESIQDIELVSQIAAHHLAGGHVMSPDQQFKIESDIASRLSSADLEAALSRAVSTPPLILAVGPDDQAAAIPDGDDILQVVAEVESATIERREDETTEVESLMTAPEPVSPSTTTIDPDFGYTILEYPNGATVMLWQSEIADQSVYMQAESFGGTSQVALEDLPEVFLVTDIIARSGVGPADAPTLQRYLSDRLVNVFPWIDETREGLTGSASTGDLESLFQLTHLTMTAPRLEEQAVSAVVDEIAVLNESRHDIPDILYDEALIDAYYGDDPRYFALPSPEQMAAFDPDAAARVYLERFGDAADFVFAFVGDFDIPQVTDLASRYLGTLPAADGDGGYIDHQPLPRREVIITTVEAGSGEQGRLGMFFTNPLQPDLKNRITAQILQRVVDIRLRERIREELSTTYSIFSSIDLQREPDPFSESFVSSTGHPDELPRISEEVMAELTDLQANGPTAAQMATAAEQLRTDVDLINNPTLADAMITSRLYPDQPVADLSRRYEVIEEITAEDVRLLAQTVFNPEQRIEIRLVPRR